MLKTMVLALVVTGMSGSAIMARPCVVVKRGPECVKAAPEIDPSSAVAGLTLLIGGIAVFLGRRSKQATQP